jgi:6-pyruvoyltetrahydropterin/6-carboxytetrahydropterin synthase
MPTRIGKQFRFEAAHHLPDHDGKCRRPHGHSYRVEVTLAGDLEDAGPKNGMVHDFSDVSRFWKHELEPHLDHQDLNLTLADDCDPPTAELIARYLYRRFMGELGDDVERVRVWETESSWAEYPA